MLSVRQPSTLKWIIGTPKSSQVAWKRGNSGLRADPMKLFTTGESVPVLDRVGLGHRENARVGH